MRGTIEGVLPGEGGEGSGDGQPGGDGTGVGGSDEKDALCVRSGACCPGGIDHCKPVGVAPVGYCGVAAGGGGATTTLPSCDGRRDDRLERARSCWAGCGLAALSGLIESRDGASDRLAGVGGTLPY